MLFRSFSAALVGCALLLAPLVAIAADRGPSTPEERKQALEFIRHRQTDPLGPHTRDQFAWVLKWFAGVPSLTVHVCTIFDKLPKGDKKNADTIFAAEFMAQAHYVLQNPINKGDRQAEYQAGAEGALHVYELLLKTNPKDREPYLDDPIQRRDSGTLQDFVKERALAACKN